MTLLAILFFLPLYLSPEWAMGGSLRTLRQPAHSHRYTHSVQRYLANTQKYTCKRAHTHTHTHTYTHTHTHTHTLTYTHAHAHTHTHTLTYVHTLTSSDSKTWQIILYCFL